MRIKTWVCLVLAFFFVGPAIAADSQTPKFKQVVIFGDSLSDNGNMYALTHQLVPAYPAYFEGRFSNGYMWSDNLTYDLYRKYFVTAQNYAVGGATALLHNPFAGYLPITLEMQYDKYIADNLFKNKDNTLYIIWIGGNDYLLGDKNVDQDTTLVVNAITSVANKLAAIPGAQFLIVSLPDIAETPIARLRNEVENLEQLYTEHDQKLHAAIQQLRQTYPNIKWMEFNFLENPILKRLVTDEKYREQINETYHIHLTNVTDPCLTGYYFSTKLTPMSVSAQGNYSVAMLRLIQQSPSLLEAYQSSALLASGSGGSICQHPEEYLFWDHIHPSATVHQVLGQLFFKMIMDNQG